MKFTLRKTWAGFNGIWNVEKGLQILQSANNLTISYFSNKYPQAGLMPEFLFQNRIAECDSKVG